MLQLAGEWVWDFWLADDGEDFHLFFLTAPKSLGDPDRRHFHASAGHAVSGDLRSWTRLPNALEPIPDSATDAAIWTGSVVRSDEGAWHLFYTGLAHRGTGFVQRICRATSDDLVRWRPDDEPILAPDPRWYDVLRGRDTTGEDCRDPWVFQDPQGDGWHMIYTARAAGPADVRDLGVVGHATSTDLVSWQAAPPLSPPGAGFEHLEVPQVEVVDGRPVLVFSCLGGRLAGPRRTPGAVGGVWTVSADAETGPFDLSRVHALTDERLYSGRLVRQRDGQWALLAFSTGGPDGTFVGAITDPVPVHWSADGVLRVDTDRLT
ncbi:MAG: hypothetical protein WKF54_07690 [Nocardioidaceae bacterium]